LKKSFFIVSIACLLSGYGYTGDLPQLGQSLRPSPEQKQNNDQIDKTEKQKIPETKEKPDFPDVKTFFPRIYSDYQIDKYSDYLQDIKQIEPLITDIKILINSTVPVKVQLFTAKVRILNFYVTSLNEKYSTKPEKNYESFKQLIKLNKTLTDSVNYHKKTGQYINLQASLNMINAVLVMIGDAKK